ncbi:MAG: 30S ribosomal protein S11 [Candidatus Tagabacteria bacterium CG09_land_8_20_14_0_10_41_14]|uniref:Small ribosomal subunit protein uS11 n=2 Tax=Candidatus Tagaibacteriota TaxID=1817918 RepID=A0A2H0WLA5_9BACT|nr:MAG: 30S ribosomal protein S11 [Candidatus Tagabacteria bacterium CG09_land_8_20_14_0_10_41_14]PJE72942.1 MAG: 30S ribosomal protein S11 [Candidatus Tagabacteria bacterium CG10_big_fil_rev_8_21_14_0_10_40_13]
MGKKRIVKEKGGGLSPEMKNRALSRIPKKKLSSGIIFIRATYNNTRIAFTDPKGNVIMWSSSGNLGFKGAKKATPFAASKVAELITDKAKAIGVRELDIQIKGVGGGRESALRSIGSKNFIINSIKDTTPVPYNGPRPKKPRRV